MPITDYGIKAAIGRALNGKDTPMSNNLGALAFDLETELPEGSSEKLDFLGLIPPMQKWGNGRQNSMLIEYPTAVTIDKFETSMSILTAWIDNDKSSQVQSRIAQLPIRRAQWKGKQVVDLINNGATGLAFDGQPFFSSSHSWNNNAVDNTTTSAAATGTTATPQEFADALMQVWTQMLGFVDDRGEPINEDMTELTVVTPLAQASAAQQALGNNQLDTGAGTIDNPLNGLRAGVKFNLIASPRVTAADKFSVYRSDSMGVPFVHFRNSARSKMTSQTSGSAVEHNKDMWEYGIKEVGGTGYGLFTSACEHTFT